MDFEHHNMAAEQPKRRRRNIAKRRLRNRAPISARLALDSQLRGSIGIVSDDLANDLFQPPSVTEPAADDTGIRYLAISPYTPGSSAVEDLAWTIVPVRLESLDRSHPAPLPHSTVLFPDSADSLQPFIQTLTKLDPTRHSLQAQRVVEIRALDVVPLHLDTVFVTVERDLLRNHDDVQSKFGGGFTTNAHGPNGMWAKGGKGLEMKKYSKKTAADAEERLTAAVREALGTQKVVHTGDVLPLPLPPHPITYAAPPPARISFCEPVSQGLLAPTTKIVLIQARPPGQRAQRSLRSTSGLLKQVAEDEADDTSNEQFYSAAEDKPTESGAELESATPPDDSETEDSAGNVSDTSDDSLDDMISLSAPQLPQPPSGVMSSITSATPRAGGRRLDGYHTPGSVASNFTSTTLRPGGRASGKVFKAEGLLRGIPAELLHPKPREDDDTGSFIYVDISTLAKIGCFSGDWVKIEATEEPQTNLFSSINLGTFNEQEEDNGDWRAVKIYGLPGLPSAKPRYSINQSSDRRPSISQRPPVRLTPSVYVPPLLLNNLDNPKYLRLSPMAFATGASRSGVLHQVKTSVVRQPPLAKEVNLLKVSTPLSMDRVLQPALFAGLKQYFESKRRLVKSGDLVGISVDEGLGRAVFSGAAATDGSAADEDLTTRLNQTGEAANSGLKKIGVAWFRVAHVAPTLPDDQDEAGEDQWGGVAVIDTATTRMVQAGSDVSKIPGTLDNGWEYWLGVKTVPKSVSDVPTPHGLVVEPPPSFVSPLQKRIRELMAVATSPRAIQLGMKPVVILLRSQQRHIGKTTLATRACADIGLHTFPIDAYDILTEGGANGGDVKTEAYLKARAERAFHCGSHCTALLIKHIEVLTADRIVSAMGEILADARVVIATTTDVEQIPEGIRSLFTHEFELTAPEEKEREGILRNAVSERSIKLAPDVDLGSVALKTAALVAGDLVDVVERASAIRTARLEKLAETASKLDAGSKVSVRDVLVSGGDAARGITKADFDAAVDAARKNFADSIGAPKIPNVSWDDVGGLTNVKDALVETIQLPLERPELFAKGMKKRSGILFYGPPGTGKTLLAKAIATEFSLNFFSVKGPELLNMYIGESEANVRRVFQRARDARPCVVFFDELDSVAPKRGNQGDSGGVMDRIVSQLLAELDGMNGGEENSGGVFVIGATNRPDLLDTALLRPGRFDKMLYLGVSDTHEKQATILEALTRKFNLDPEVSLRRVADRLPLTYTGADLYALCSDAMLKAITRKATAVDEKIKQLPGEPVSTAYFFDHLATPDDVAVMVTEADFTRAQGEMVPSVSAKELEHFERIRRSFESDDKKQEPENTSGSGSKPPQTIGDALEALKLGHQLDGIVDGPVMNGDHVPLVNGKGKGKMGSAMARSASGHSISSKGKGKGKHKALTAGGGEPDGYTEDGPVANGDEDYIVRTDHLVDSSQ
ncbi:AAA family ATPase peroxin 6 [Aspergillus clavatus NRRL 1]|uniref:Peroxisomal ATPase PEX6 n=1 Tax=Aspergillus clavatus (strain ATCC 1007 / CBS 513.65 / DSM 816 / NCTC 3887 / NRRL 1 / QM 1276 / 107) TaxID=344612 RepID=A1CJR6_ASPCL|nr:peroxisome assembly factor-2 (peroxisomal-type atpase 1) [Aspergillus clavatus NRRL 1]EAW09390.1 peroxisome assembly factor-2 (peroxisomal-type atpase 1) [Aspergillus clavatus NRRL 1]